MVSITRDLVAVLVVQLCNIGTGKARLVGVLSEDLLGHIDHDGVAGLVFLGVVLGRPADAHLLTSSGLGHGAEAAAIGLGDGALTGLDCAGLDTVDVVRAGDKIVFVLLVVSAGGVAIEATELNTGVDGVLAGIAHALTIASAPTYLMNGMDADEMG